MSDFLHYNQPLKLKKWQRDCIPLCEFSLDFKTLPSKVLGIDVEAKYQDIKRIFFKRYLKQIIAIGEDPEDMLQEILQGLLVRNKGKCPYDPKKSAFSTYVTMVCHCVMTNILKKHNRVKGAEIALEPIERVIFDIQDQDTYREYDRLKNEVGSLFQGDYRKVYDLLSDGHKTREISEITGMDGKEVRRKIKEIREKVSLSTEYGPR